MGMIEDEISRARLCAGTWAELAGAAEQNGVSARLVALMRDEAAWYGRHADGLEKWWGVNEAWLVPAPAGVSRLLTALRPAVRVRRSYRVPARGHEGSST